MAGIGRFRTWLPGWMMWLAVSAWVVACGDGGDFIDNDGDGWAPPADCDDNNSEVHPLAPETPYDGVDQDCDGKDQVDIDRDGYEAEAAGGTDCDDGDPGVYPNADEVPYDGVDQDCDGLADDNDADGDGHDAESQGGDDCCDNGFENSLGCNPVIAGSIHPGAEEISYDGIDQNCNGLDYGGSVTEGDNDGDGFAEDVRPEGIDCDDTDDRVYPGAVESCNGIDDDCDGYTDEGLTDNDGDGVCSCLDCDDYDPGRSPLLEEVAYDDIDQDCDGADLTDVDGDGQNSIAVPFGQDCNDNDPEIYDGAPERCNNLDDDCDGQVDEDFIGQYQDADLDTWLNCPGGDCDDDPVTGPTVNPWMPEVGANSVDDDCDGLTDEVDADGDGYFVTTLPPQPTEADCDDSDGTIYPGADELPYDGVDQDCNGVDLVDVDGDTVMAVEAGGLDCDDRNPDAKPGNPEICSDPSDNDCDGTVNEDCGAGTNEDVEVIAGAFIMGRPVDETVLNPDQQPDHTVNLGAYTVDKYEVTMADYRRCVNHGPCTFDFVWFDSLTDEHYWESQARGLHPAINLSWDQARLYCQWVGKDLPTEAQWEKAARGEGNDVRDYPWGDIQWAPGPEGFDVRQPVSCDRANHRNLCDLELCAEDVVEVDLYPTGVSPFGAFNLAGNVAEWVLDWYDPNYYAGSPLDDPPGPGAGTHRVIRGGSFLDTDYYIEVTARALLDPTWSDWDLGFRCARIPPSSP